MEWKKISKNKRRSHSVIRSPHKKGVNRSAGRPGLARVQVKKRGFRAIPGTPQAAAFDSIGD
jgi:hypothetical protein